MVQVLNSLALGEFAELRSVELLILKRLGSVLINSLFFWAEVGLRRELGELSL